MPNPTTLFQTEIAELLRGIYPEPTPILSEWRTIDTIDGLYSPRIDVAVGPFSTARGGNCIVEYNDLMDSSRTFIERLLHWHTINVTSYRTQDKQINQALHFSNFKELKSFNANARCLLAIEIEHKVTRKHLLGGAVNAAALGRLGIVVGWTGEKIKALVKLQSYWDYLGSVGKNTFITWNLIILSPEQLLESISHTT